MHLDELLPEMLEMVCGYLSLRDRQALGATSRRLEAVAMQPRFIKTITLCLNKVTKQLDEYGFMNTINAVIPKDIVEGSSRHYKNVKIELCAELELDWVSELLELFEARQTPVKHLEVVDHNCLQVMRLYTKCQSVFGHIESLEVHQWGKIRRNFRGRHLVLPALRRLFWYERPDFEEALHPVPGMDIALSAPQLEHAFISIPTTWDDIVSLTGRHYMPHLHLTKHPKLRSLALFIDKRTVQALSRTLHPTLEILTLFFSTLSNLDSSYWTGLVRCVPNLRTLELVARKRTSPTTMILTFFTGNPSIRTLILHDCSLEKTVFVLSALQSIQHLQIHESTVELQDFSITIELAALKTLYVRAGVPQTVNTLKLHLPNVREMSLFCKGRMVDVLSAPRLEQLCLRYTCRTSLPFLDLPLLHLHTLVVQINRWGILQELLTVNAPGLRHLTIICHLPPGMDEMLSHIENGFPQLETLTIAGL